VLYCISIVTSLRLAERLIQRSDMFLPGSRTPPKSLHTQSTLLDWSYSYEIGIRSGNPEMMKAKAVFCPCQPYPPQHRGYGCDEGACFNPRMVSS